MWAGRALVDTERTAPAVGRSAPFRPPAGCTLAANACALTPLRYVGRTRSRRYREDCTGRRAVGAFPAAGGVHAEVANACALTTLRLSRLRRSHGRRNTQHGHRADQQATEGQHAPDPADALQS